MAEKGVTAESEAKRAYLQEVLDGEFVALKLGKAGEKREEGDEVVTASDVVESFRRRTTESSETESTEQALVKLLEVNEVPLKEAIKIGILWGSLHGFSKTEGEPGKHDSLFLHTVREFNKGQGEDSPFLKAVKDFNKGPAKGSE